MLHAWQESELDFQRVVGGRQQVLFEEAAAQARSRIGTEGEKRDGGGKQKNVTMAIISAIKFIHSMPHLHRVAPFSFAIMMCIIICYK